MSRSTTVNLLVTLSPEQLDELASRTAKHLLAATLDDAYDQEHPPAGVSRRAFLEAARVGAFESRKVGKKVIAKRDAVDAWLASRPSAKRPKPSERAATLDEELSRIAANNGARIT